MASYVKGNLINLFYWDGSKYVALAYSQSHELSFQVSTTDISSKDHGIYPDKEVTGSSWTMSGEYYFTVENAKLITEMAKSTKPYTFCLAQTGSSAEDAANGLKPVTGAGEKTEWTPGASLWVQYGNALVTSATVSAGAGETATLKIDLQGIGALVDTDETLTKNAKS